MPRLLSVNVREFARFIAMPFSMVLEHRGLVLVEGVNHDYGGAFDSNAAGKSMLFEAITWGLTGKMARYGDERIGSDEVCHEDHGADVDVFFETSRGRFRSCRSRSQRGSSRLKIEARGSEGEWTVLKGSGLHAAEGDDDLASLLGFDFRTLRHAIFLQGTGLDVAGSTFAKQMKLLESVLRFDDYTKAAKIAKRKADTFYHETQQQLATMEQWTRQSENARSALKELEALDETTRENELIETIRSARHRVASLKGANEALRIAKAEMNVVAAEEARYKVLAHVAGGHRETLRALEVGACPTCRGDLSMAMLETLREVSDNEYADALNSQTQATRLVTEKQIALHKAIDDADSLDKGEDDLENAQRELQEVRARLGRRLSLVQAQQAKIDEAETRLVEMTEEIGDTKRQMAIANALAKRDYEQMKAETLGKAGPILNDACDRYGAILCDDALRLEFDTLRESRSENLLRIRRGTTIVPYESLSNGERRRIDLMSALALRECARWRSGPAGGVNIAVWDEVFDKLDDSGLRRAIEVLQRDLTELESVFVITHNPALKALFPGAHVLRVVRRDGISRIEE